MAGRFSPPIVNSFLDFERKFIAKSVLYKDFRKTTIDRELTGVWWNRA